MHEQSQEELNSNNQDSPKTHITPNSKRGGKATKMSPESSIGNQNSPGSILNKDPSQHSYKPPHPIKKNYAPSVISNAPSTHIAPSSNMMPDINTTSKKNVAYINITGEGAKPVGPIGLKKAEKELILRRYKYNHNLENIQRVALIYGQ